MTFWATLAVWSQPPITCWHLVLYIHSYIVPSLVTVNRLSWVVVYTHVCTYLAMYGPHVPLWAANRLAHSPAICVLCSRMIVSNFVAASINNWFQDIFGHVGLHQLHTKVFCTQLTKASMVKTSCNQLLIDIATYVIALKNIAMSLNDIITALLLLCRWQLTAVLFSSMSTKRPHVDFFLKIVSAPLVYVCSVV